MVGAAMLDVLNVQLDIDVSHDEPFKELKTCLKRTALRDLALLAAASKW
jgi:hypothetical protein